jgi:hypothetical protein
MLLALFGRDPDEAVAEAGWLASQAKVPQSNAVRWQWVLIEERLIEFGPRGAILSARPVQLTKTGRRLMQKYLLDVLAAREGSFRGDEQADS